MGLLQESRQMLGESRALMAKSNRLLDDGQKALDSLANGFETVIEVDGVPRKVKIGINPDYNEWPGARCDFVGGLYDGAEYDLTDGQRKSKTITLLDKDGDGEPERYVWNGYFFEYDAPDDLTGTLLELLKSGLVDLASAKLSSRAKGVFDKIAA